MSWQPLAMATWSWRTKALLTRPASSTLSPALSSVSWRRCPARWDLPLSSFLTMLRSPSPCSAIHLTIFTRPAATKLVFSSRRFRDRKHITILLRKALLLDGVYADMFDESTFEGVVDDLRSLLHEVVMFFSGGLPDVNDLKWFPLLGLDSHMLLVVSTKGSTFVFKKDIKIGKLVALDNINNYAIFIGHQRCLAIDVDKFPGIEANCVYYTEILGLSAHICKCNIKDRKVERISEAAEFVKQGKQFVLVVDRPFTIIHLLSSYTINIPESQLALQQIP
ncbi:uncharacterized protein LOC119282191 [Triticum dicoccoides]|uniref:uncharacterized protein LOC119282191 n=1 Tax=Triticum dicoccoides TaxID=85692 RepID=UPI00188EC8F1|nr:uncharacterized protein LOC119282191 [Triticum dicoccoides]